MSTPTTPAAWSINWWRDRHEALYFPAMEEHKDWKVYESLRQWFFDLCPPFPTDSALEIGCGYGQWMVPLSKIVTRVAGFDLHPSLVAKAAEKFLEHGVRNCEVKLGDGLSVPWPDRSFSLIYSISVFQHVPRTIVASYLKEATRVLTLAGRGLFHFRFADGVGVYSEDIGVDHQGDFSTGWTEAQARSAAHAAGLPLPIQTEVLGDSLFLTCGVPR